MRTPRRPVLAACCAVLLLATAVRWVRSQYRHDLVDIRPHRNGRLWRIATAGGALFVGWSDSGAAMTPGVSVSTTPVSERVKIGWFDWRMPQSPRWSGYLDVPLWFAALLPAAGLWWSLRRPKVRTGFPLETTVESISEADRPSTAPQ